MSEVPLYLGDPHELGFVLEIEADLLSQHQHRILERLSDHAAAS